jgi:hypothetical protein
MQFQYRLVKGIAYRGLVEVLSRDHHRGNETQSISPDFAFHSSYERTVRIPYFKRLLCPIFVN